MSFRPWLAGMALAALALCCGRIGYPTHGFDGDAGMARDVAADAMRDTGADDTPDTSADGTRDTATTSPASCLDLLRSGTATDGVYSIDVDGPAGPIAPVAVYCDMTFDGGGWTMIQSYDGTKTPQSFAADDGLAPFLTAAPRPLTFGAWGRLLLDPLIGNVTQVNIRNSFAADAQNANSTTGCFATSRVPAANEVTTPVANLRIHHVLNDGTNGGAADWTGPRVANLTWSPAARCTLSVPRYPNVYWACNNVMGLHITEDAARWDYSATTQQTMEVFVR